ncbi:glutathione S-transferase family protein [Pseudoalteromonas rubra]|nr:glutathione S-transferase family protein [Pseudoalteromonas rubra]
MVEEISIKLFELGPTRSARVRWALLEAGLTFESVQNGVDIFKSTELLNIHPLGKLPAVLINGQPLFESAAIVTAIADLVPDKKLIAEPSSWLRNLHNQWVCFTLSELEPFVQSTEINSMDFVLPAEQHVREIVPQNNMLYKKAAAALEKHFSRHDYLVDDQFSATDIVLAYTLCWGQEQKLLDDFPNINEYMDRLYNREHCTLKKP